MGQNSDGEVCYRGNPRFTAPEALEPQRRKNRHGEHTLYGHRRDVYGAGIILAELLLGKDENEHLFRGSVSRQERIAQRKAFCRDLGAKDSPMETAFHGLCSYGQMKHTDFNIHGADLVKHMSCWDRRERISSWRAQEHTFCSLDPSVEFKSAPREIHVIREDPLHETWRDVRDRHSRSPRTMEDFGYYCPERMRHEEPDPSDHYALFEPLRAFFSFGCRPCARAIRAWQPQGLLA